MSKLTRIQEQILTIKSQLTEKSLPYQTERMFDDREKEVLKSQLEELETERRFILDRRESWLPRTLWNLLVPIVVAIIATIFTLWLSESVSWSN